MPEAGPLRLEARLCADGFELDVRLEAAAGETVVLVGPNGAGKSTCLELVAGLLRPDSGLVACGGEIWCDTVGGRHLPPPARRVGLLFQDHALFPHLSVVENVRYGPLARGRSRSVAAATARVWIERLGLSGLEGRPALGLSGGQRQRVALARALASEPRVLLLDEPFGALDVSTRESVRSELRAFLGECGLPTLLVTHDAVDALALGDRIVVLEAGRVSQAGTRAQLLAEPRTPFVAELASLNLYRAEVSGGTGLKTARVGKVAFQVLADGLAGPAFLCFAPCEVALLPEREPGSPQNVLAGRVVELRALPDRQRVVVDAGVTLVADVTHEAAASLQLAPGRVLWASVKATAIRVYG